MKTLIIILFGCLSWINGTPTDRHNLDYLKAVLNDKGIDQAESSTSFHQPSAAKDFADQNADAEVAKTSFNTLITDDGKLYINGQVINPFPSSNKERYPKSAGWLMFVYKGITFYFLKQGAAISLVPVKQKFSTAVVDEDGLHEVFHQVSDGNVFSSNGELLDQYPSNQKDHPSSAGWMVVKHDGKAFFHNTIDGHLCFGCDRMFCG